jgi:hypothetical protein
MVKARLRGIRLDDATELATRALDLPSAADVRRLLAQPEPMSRTRFADPR